LKFPIDPKRRAPRRTICEVLREIYRIAEAAGNREIIVRTNEAHDMAKRMDEKLRGYKADWDANMWGDGRPESVREIPSMGGGKIWECLERYAAAVPPKGSIVELGPWLGAGTVHLARGAARAGAILHCYDRWTCVSGDAAKAQLAGLNVRPGDDLLPHFKHFMGDHLDRIELHRGEIAAATWRGGPIHLYVDDASKSPSLWAHAMQTFGPSFISGTILILMDFFYYEKAGERYRAQADWMAAHTAEFELLDDHVGVTSTAVFRKC
jgi:hypothetical protein